MFIGQIQELKDLAQELPAFQKSQTMCNSERRINSRVSRKAHELFTFFAGGIFLNTPRIWPDFQIFSRTGMKIIPPPKFPFDIVIDPQTKTPKQVFCKFWEHLGDYFLEHLERVWFWISFFRYCLSLPGAKEPRQEFLQIRVGFSSCLSDIIQ